MNIQWSNEKLPPALGTEVEIVLNGWEGHKGKITGYKVDGEWLGALVLVKDRPEWHKNDPMCCEVCYFAGCELKY